MKTIRNCIFSFLSALLLCVPFFTDAQCPTGAIGVSGGGCGCLAGCNLTSLGGPNCSGVVGNCSAGQVAMSTNIVVPAGCTFTVSATMANRSASCSASGGDGGDQMKVDLPAGSKAFQSGAGNATLNDSYTLTGPGTIRVSGTANRADEIITYTTTSTGCINCSVSLPVELLRFEAFASGETVECTWETSSEINSDFFTVERGTDGLHFEPVGGLKGAGNSTQPHFYKLYDSSPVKSGTSYYRLAQRDFDGTVTHFPVSAVRFGEPSVSVFPNPSSGQLTITGHNAQAADLLLLNALGETVPLTIVPADDTFTCRLSGLSEGLYLLIYTIDSGVQTEKIVVTKQ